MKSIRTLLIVAICFAFVGLLHTKSTTYAVTDRSSIHSFYDNPLSKTPDQSSNYNGIEYYARFVAKNKKTGNTEYSSKDWDMLAPWNPSHPDYDYDYAAVEASADVYDMTNSSDLAVVGQVKNTTGQRVNINLSYDFGNKNKKNGVARFIDDTKAAEITGTYGSDVNIQLRCDGNVTYTYAQARALSNFSWSSVNQIQITGTMDPNDTINFNIPLTTSQATKGDYIELPVTFYGSPRKSTKAKIRLSEYLYNVDDRINGVYVGAYKMPDNTYKQVPDKIQAIMPKVQKSDLIYSMSKLLFTTNLAKYEADGSDGVAYDHSYYLIKLDRIFNAVKDEGYSVNYSANRGLWKSYQYNMKSGLKLTDKDGQDVEFGTYDADAGVQLSRYYVELHKVLDTKDITINVGDAWNKFDNLTWRKVIGGSRDITDAELDVTNNVDNTRPGTYWVKYSYKVDTDKYVTKTAKVIVKDNSSGNNTGGNRNNRGNQSKRYVILASGYKYTDVLTATVLGNEKKCPILLTSLDEVSDNTMKEIKRLGVDEVIISGGPASVSEKVVSQLKKAGYNVRRIAGKDRYETAEKIGDEVRLTSNNKNEVILVDGTNFPDVITLSTLANQKRVPILLTQPKALNSVTNRLLGAWRIDKVTIGGEKTSVSKNVEDIVKAKTKAVDRIGGATRYETAYKVADQVRRLTNNEKDLILVDGTKFPDGITISSLAAKFKAPILLTKPDKLHPVTETAVSQWGIENLLIGGGYNSVSKNIEDTIRIKNKERVAGSDRYNTAVEISKRYTDSRQLAR
nr:cell wall-binding repeat-containing protein [uncultured Peptostreptococcus sp.]